uniref:Short-chain dehydrogenase/reductase 3 n=1 Tax=Lepeophtheirus salmonis TaxID=72036 RepID=A0A0K2UU71_LEPSM
MTHGESYRSYPCSALFDISKCFYHVLKGFLLFFLNYVMPPKPKSLFGEVALITGAGGGLGRELSLQLTDLGVKVICVDINKVSVEETCRITQKKGSLGSRAFVCDISVPKEVGDLVKKISLLEDELGPITMLFNNAGIAHCKPFLKHTNEEIQSLFQVNVISHMYLIKEYLPKFLDANKGHLVSIGSIAGSIGTANLVPYCSTKYAIRGLTESLFMELREMYPNTSVKMTTAHPYTISTSLIPKPKNRFNSLFPIMNACDVASNVIGAVRRDEEVISMPPFASLASSFYKCFPRQVQLAILDLLECGVYESG